ncbi:MAG TPA: hypothetical protein DCE83_08125 [Enterococcus sp.]|uniref:Uncharacterized protein n=1 Tax=Enterococcus casseliflavus TaxID=37734 RepID=A0A415EW25_ENTCA|nr:hypothetical protein DW084_04525 [Enterococcus casseliflavus]HAB96717.1 hypothetical protein [Enterococcus sp.]
MPVKVVARAASCCYLLFVTIFSLLVYHLLRHFGVFVPRALSFFSLSLIIEIFINEFLFRAAERRGSYGNHKKNRSIT